MFGLDAAFARSLFTNLYCSEPIPSGISVDSATTDGVADQKETTWPNEKWTQYFGYYCEIPELQSVIDAKATWTIGKGFKAGDFPEVVLNKLKGWGKDSFNTILENLLRTMHIGGDSFAEIIKRKDGELINLKPLDPASIMIVVNRKGLIKRYEQISKVKTPNKKFKPEKIFHLARNRVADQIHGTSMITALEKTIKNIKEAEEDYKRVLHRNIDPMMIFHLDTEDVTKIAAFKAKTDAARGNGENMYIPKDAVVPEQISLAPNATLNPLPWITAQKEAFYEQSGVPRIVVGGAGGLTEAAVKIAYLAFQQTIEEEQLFVEEQVGMQLGITLELEFPASLENELLSDNKKDGAQNIDASETTAGEGK